MKDDLVRVILDDEELVAELESCIIEQMGRDDVSVVPISKDLRFLRWKFETKDFGRENLAAIREMRAVAREFRERGENLCSLGTMGSSADVDKEWSEFAVLSGMTCGGGYLGDIAAVVSYCGNIDRLRKEIGALYLSVSIDSREVLRKFLEFFLVVSTSETPLDGDFRGVKASLKKSIKSSGTWELFVEEVEAALDRAISLSQNIVECATRRSADHRARVAASQQVRDRSRFI